MRTYISIEMPTKKIYFTCREHEGVYKHEITLVYGTERSDVIC